jgi:hypothetical protein
MKPLNAYEAAALEKCRSLGLRPLPNADHHTDAQFLESDRQIGEALAYFLGTLFADVDGKNSRYWYHERTSVDEWMRVARALRMHGLTITNSLGEPPLTPPRTQE